jgi:signal peptidase
MKLTKKTIEILVLVAIISIIVFLPLYARTGTYPLSIVDGNSMYPNLQNGDLAYYSATNTRNIPNGTVIVFVQGDTGNSLLDGLIRPVVIHRVIGEIIQSDGTVCYETKGDNNDVKDPFLTRSDHVLGTATVIVPKVGLFVLFLKSPQGLIATIGIISLAYLSIHDMKRKEEKKKEKLLAALSKKVINGDLPNEQFGKIELAIRYSDDIESFGIKDPSILAFVGWLKNGGLDQNWKLRNVTCNNCSGIALELRGEKNNSLAICPHCHRVLWNTTMVLTEKIFNKVLLQSIDESLSSLGSASKVNLYSHLETAFTLKKKEIPTRLDDFSFALERILGKGAIHLNLLLIENFKKKLSSFCHMNHKSSDFQEYVKQAKECVENMKNGKERETLIGNTSLDILEDQPEMSAISQEQF